MLESPNPQWLPHAPPLSTSDLPGAGGAIAGEPSDFLVDEVPLYTASGTGEHWYVRLEKQRLTTPALVQIVARAAGVDGRDVGYAGLKDKHALTRQWLSVPGKAPAPETWTLPEGVRLLESTRHGNKLRTGHLRGNRFRIRIERAGSDAFERASVIARRLTECGLLNYFGAQRFGISGASLGQALDWLAAGARVHGLPHFLSKLYPSVIQAEVFNRYLTARRELGLTRPLPGEVLRLATSSAVFQVEDAEREAERLAKGELELTGPIFGPKMRPSRGAPLELEARAVAELGLGPPELERLGRLAPGTRRDLLARVTELSVRDLPPDRLELEFELPSGSYATELVREITRARFLSDSDARGAA